VHGFIPSSFVPSHQLDQQREQLNIFELLHHEQLEQLVLFELLHHEQCYFVHSGFASIATINNQQRL
jgi:hypothetical protein